MEQPSQPEVPAADASVRAAAAPLETGRPLTVTSFGLTDVGRSRKHNEDQFVVAELTRAMHLVQSSVPQPRTLLSEKRAHLFMVADGMGGHQAGEQASALAVVAVEDFILNTFRWVFRLQGEVAAEFQEALRVADARIFEEAAGHPELAGMGTTLTLAYTVNSLLYVIHVGDSRCYLFRDGILHQLTRDHTLVQEMVRSGAIAADQAKEHHLRNIITNAVGGHEPGIEVEIHRLLLEPGDQMLLCSDGLTEMLSDAELANLLATEPTPEAASRALVDAANAQGGRDNITALVVRFDPTNRDD
jgi:serine/threonine protein phosphatase PrpC